MNEICGVSEIARLDTGITPLDWSYIYIYIYVQVYIHSCIDLYTHALCIYEHAHVLYVYMNIRAFTYAKCIYEV